MKKKISLEENQIASLNHRGSRNFQNECKLLDDKKFVLKHMKESYLSLSKISRRLQRDKDVFIKHIQYKKITSFDLPCDSFLNDKDILDNFFLYQKEHCLLYLMSCDDIKIHTKENITRAINLSRNILRISISEKDIGKEIINSNKTLYDLCFIGVWSYYSPPWQRIELPDIYSKKTFKQLALHKSPDTAFAFMLNDEISEEEYAKIFVENFIFSKDYKNSYEYLDNIFQEYIDRKKKYHRHFTQKFTFARKAVVREILKKTKSLNFLINFLSKWKFFNTKDVHAFLRENLDLKNIPKNTIHNIFWKNRRLYDGKLSTECLFLANEFKSIDLYEGGYDTSPTISARKATLIACEELGARPTDFSIHKRSPKCLNYIRNLDSKVYSSKAFLKEFIYILPCIPDSPRTSVYFDKKYAREVSDWLQGFIQKEVIKYLEKSMDLQFFKTIIKYQGWNWWPNQGVDIDKQIYFKVSDALRTPEINRYFLQNNPNILDKSFIYLDNHDVFIQAKFKRYFDSVIDDEFYLTILKKNGIHVCQEHHFIPKRYLFDENFIKKAVLISSKILNLAPHPIKSNKEIVKLACLKAKSSFRYAANELKKDKIFLDDIFYKDPLEKFRKAHISIRTDRDILMPAFKKYPKDVIDYLSIRKILNLDMQLFNSDEKNEIYQGFIQKIDTYDIFLLAKYKSFFFEEKQGLKKVT
jgi:hypothetical protein